MLKSELVEKIAEANPHLYQRDVGKIVNAIFEHIAKALCDGDRVELRGFGAFSVKNRSARVGRNPRTGTNVAVTEKYHPFFKTGRDIASKQLGVTLCLRDGCFLVEALARSKARLVARLSD